MYDAERDVLGLDVGTGASCIYPLLGCSQRPKWRFAGTGRNSCVIIWQLLTIRVDIDEKSLQFAKQNVQDNELQQRIKLLKTTSDGPMFPLDKMGLQKLVL